MDNFTKCEDPDKMQHFIRSTLFVKVKEAHQTNEYNIVFKNNNPTPLDMYNGRLNHPKFIVSNQKEES